MGSKIHVTLTWRVTWRIVGHPGSYKQLVVYGASHSPNMYKPNILEVTFLNSIKFNESSLMLII